MSIAAILALLRCMELAMWAATPLAWIVPRVVAFVFESSSYSPCLSFHLRLRYEDGGDDCAVEGNARRQQHIRTSLA